MEPIRGVEGDELRAYMKIIVRNLVLILHSHVLLLSPRHIIDFE